jgi:hypothetical protein
MGPELPNEFERSAYEGVEGVLPTKLIDVEIQRVPVRHAPHFYLIRWIREVVA